jgi:hypothetical protein
MLIRVRPYLNRREASRTFALALGLFAGGVGHWTRRAANVKSAQSKRGASMGKR